ncbi:hypothetical protein DFH07DRAFT_415516 [Mycena maculata]|uniref:Uncharacterized protein n=1 Tax=Mycena maculata TaxID=230809 RepID=A0AAD7NI28_9AGAR|nr:hypothetical protein DFH07DRAFT_415516 [Mycena maculata]
MWRSFNCVLLPPISTSASRVLPRRLSPLYRLSPSLALLVSPAHCCACALALYGLGSVTCSDVELTSVQWTSACVLALLDSIPHPLDGAQRVDRPHIRIILHSICPYDTRYAHDTRETMVHLRRLSAKRAQVARSVQTGCRSRIYPCTCSRSAKYTWVSILSMCPNPNQ